MLKLKLRTQFLVATLLVIATLTGASLFIIRYTVRSEIDSQVRRGVGASVRAFESVEQQRELQLSRTAAMLAEQPILKALMTTEHAPTIQDASGALWKLSGSDLMVLTSTSGNVLAYHVSSTPASAPSVEEFAKRSIREGQESAWWFNNSSLFWTFLRPVTAGTGGDNRLLGYVILGYQIDSHVAAELARVSGSQIVLATEHEIIASTLPKQSDTELSIVIAFQRERLSLETRDIAVSGQAYAAGSVMVQKGPTPIYCYVLMPLSQSEGFLRRLNITIFVLGFAAICAAAAIITWISRAITRPLDNLVAGVRALSTGDYSYRISPTGSAEVAELGTAFAGMRIRLQESQRLRLEAEQHAVVARTASAISHDLRHYLAAVLANAEFLYDSHASDAERREIYEEIRTASDQMVDLIDSLRELSNEQAAMTVRPASIDETMERAITAVKARHEFKHCEVRIVKKGDMRGSFDDRKMERVFFNLVLNACEAKPEGNVTVEIDSGPSNFEIEVRDHGTGIPESIRESVFDPFVSVGKPNGSGLGLAIVQKIVRDHRGSAYVASTSQQGTTIRISLPREMSLESVEAVGRSV